MIENSGKPVSASHKAFILRAARDDMTRTNEALSAMGLAQFGRKVDQTTIGGFRREAGILSSREARAAAQAKTELSSNQLEYLRGLIEKIIVPSPDTIRLSDSMWEVGIGRIGVTPTKMWIEHERGKLIRCWLTAKEESWLQQALTTDSLRESFIGLVVQGRATIQKIIRHNSAIDLGWGEIPITEVLELSRTRDPKTFNALDRQPYELWLEHVALLKAIELFKLEVEEHFAPPPIQRLQLN